MILAPGAGASARVSCRERAVDDGTAMSDSNTETGDSKLTQLPFEVDLTALSSRGMTPGDRRVPLYVTMPIPILVLLGEIFEFEHFGESAGIALGVILVPIAIFNLLLGFHASFVDRAPGAARLRVDSAGLRLDFANGRVDNYRWTDARMHLTMRTMREGDPSGRPGLVVLSRFWRPPSQIPNDVAARLIVLFDTIALRVSVEKKQIRHYGWITVRDIRGSPVAIRP